MKIAISLFGLVGSAEGKSGKTTAGADKVLDLSYQHWRDYVIKQNKGHQIDFFVHSWSVDLQDKINELFKPVSAIYEPKREFKVPDYVVGEEIRKQSHYSRWFSTQKSMKLKAAHEATNNFKYDWVMSARFDIAWKVPVIFSQHKPTHFFYGGMNRRGSIKVIDFWFFSNSENMDKFCDLYDHIDQYSRYNPEKSSPRRISSHSLAQNHMDKIGFRTKSLWKYEHFTDPTKTDYPLIRYQYFGAQN